MESIGGHLVGGPYRDPNKGPYKEAPCGQEVPVRYLECTYSECGRDTSKSGPPVKSAWPCKGLCEAL